MLKPVVCGKFASPVKSYVLITAAYNEEQYIEATIRSVISQTILPSRWVIVSDGSTDRTDELVAGYATSYPFMRLLRVERYHKRDFASKVYALNEAASHIQEVASRQYIGHLDADITFGPQYYSSLLERFERDPALGLAGGSVCEWNGENFIPRPTNRTHSVAGGIQMFRRDCYESLNGFLPLRYGGEDWCAEVTARMNGWTVESFLDLTVFHHRPTGGAAGLLKNAYREGLMDFSLGTHPFFEVVRLARRFRILPARIAVFARLCGFLAGYCRLEDRSVSDRFVRFLRTEEMSRLWRSIRAGSFFASIPSRKN